MPKAQRLDINNISAIGRLSLALNNPTHAEISPPMQIWRKPISDDALPMFFEKGARAIADPFGNVIPRHINKMKKNEIVEYTPYTSKILPAK
jgi:hypothetical protein